MKLQTIREKFGILSTWSTYPAMFALLAMVLLATTNVTMRFFFTEALRGFYEITELAMIVVVFLGLGYTMKLKGHVSVGMFVDHLPPRARAILSSIIYLITVCFMAILIYQSTKDGFKHWDVGTVSVLLRIPNYPFRFLIAFGCLLFCGEALFIMLDSVAKFRKKALNKVK